MTRMEIPLNDPTAAISEMLPASYDGPCRLLDWRHGARAGMTVDLRLLHPGPAGHHPFRGMPTTRERGQRFLVVVRFPSETPGRGVPVHSGEAVLERWSESDRSGMMARLVLDDGPDGVQGRHPFFGLAVGPSKGEALDFAAYAIADDETVVGPSKVRGKTPFHQLTEVTQSHILCADPRFQRFLESRLDVLVPDEATRGSLLAMRTRPKDFADAAVRTALGVSTRSVMNGDGDAAARVRGLWRRLMAAYEDAMWSEGRVAPVEA